MGFVLLLVPVFRMTAKRILDSLGLWRRETWIIGNGPNAQEAFKAISSERNLGLEIVGFIASYDHEINKPIINNIPVLPNDIEWLKIKIKIPNLSLLLNLHKVK